MKSLLRTHRIPGLPARLAPLLFTALLIATPFEVALAQTAPTLGTAQSFAVLGASTVTNTGPSVITGNLGVSPGTAITGFPPGTVLGTQHAGDAVALQAQVDAGTAYAALTSQACTTTYAVPTDIGGLTLSPGVYCFASSAQITGTLTLNGGGNPAAVFIFKTGSTLITASSSSVQLINGAMPCNVFFQVGSSATLGTSTSFMGNILALASITLNTSATISGRALALTGAVTLDSNAVSLPCVDTTPPVVVLKTIVNGPPKQVILSAQDIGSGLASIQVLQCINCTAVVAPFTVGTTSPVAITATKTNPNLSSVIQVRAVDVAGNVTIFDPVDFEIKDGDKQSTEKVHVGAKEHFALIVNGDPGVNAIEMTVDGRKLPSIRLKNGEGAKIDFRAYLSGISDHWVKLTARGPMGGTSWIVITQQ